MNLLANLFRGSGFDAANQNNEFNIQNEDFPALPNSTAQQRSLVC